MNTLVVSLPSGRVVDVRYASKLDVNHEVHLSEFVAIGDSLRDKLDGKGAQILTLQAFSGAPKPHMFARLKS